uniref:Branched-chain amino acid ABC transporter permease n=1 Tax=Ectopseudomonas oleovorans TaxID=301 RepID=A0A653AYH3_ECTOL
MSLLVFAGSAQFIAISLLAGGAGITVVLLTTFVVNLRHALYSASMQPTCATCPSAGACRWPSGSPTKPTRWWCSVMRGVTRAPIATGISSVRRWPCTATGNCARWSACCSARPCRTSVPGAWTSPCWRPSSASSCRCCATQPQVAAALVAAGVALACHALPYKLGLMAAAASGIVVGVWLERRRPLLQEELV